MRGRKVIRNMLKLINNLILISLVVCLNMVIFMAVSQAEDALEEDAAPSAAPSGMKAFLAAVPPTAADAPYGKHPKQVLTFWKAVSDKPTPLLFFIHGGSWTHGDRSKIGADTVKSALADGISVVSVEYRFIHEATADGLVPPVKGPMLDCARALQFVRSKAGEWNIDKSRIGASGGSAGGCTSLWLAFHDDLADPQSADPIARESTRLTCAAVHIPQTSLDPKQMREWMPNIGYGAHAFGAKKDFWLPEMREKFLPWIKEYSPYEHVSADDPPVFLSYTSVPDLGNAVEGATHSANFGVKLKEHCDELKSPCELSFPGSPDGKYKSAKDFLRAHLKPQGK